MKYLITGKNGQLAQEFIRQFESRSQSYAAPAEQELDITDAGKVRDLVASFRPDVILNCAAYNMVDQAETDRAAAFRVNAEGPRILAEAASEHGARLVHFSSDYVFDGRKGDVPYTEGDRANPLNEYGRSKLAGEGHVGRILGPRSFVFRLSWVFSGLGKQNFSYKFLERVKKGAPLAVTDDEVSVPTWTTTIAAIVLAAVDQDASGLYHLTNSGHCSRYQWAQLVLKLHGIDRPIQPISMDSLKLPAARPRFSAMSNALIARRLNIAIMPWHDAVTACERNRVTIP
jgi:dTDP-4-dehydrorhamnose reductase